MIKRIITYVLSFFVILTLVACQKDTKSDEEVQKEFDTFIKKEFVDAMENDYITMHTYLTNPKNYGVDENKVKVRLGIYLDEDSQKEAIEKEENTYEKFKEFDRDKLTEQQKDIYDVYEYQNSLSEKLNDDKYDYYEPAFQSMTGIHYQIPTLFSDWELRNEKDVKDLILLVKDIKPYIDSALDYTKKQEEKGLLMLDIDNIMKYCKNIIDKGDKSSVLVSMNENIDALSLDKTKTEKYKKELKKAFSSSFIVAYQNIYDTMNELKKSGQNNTEGLANFKYGKDYFELKLQQKIGSLKTAKEVKKMMEKGYDEHVAILQDVVMNNTEKMQPLIDNKLPKTSYKNYKEILDSNKKKIKENFPSVNNLDYVIKDVNQEIASDSGVSAYFNIPAIDGNSTKQLRVNPKNNSANTIDTYSTVSHEGFPGHMYQYAYMYENVDSDYIKSLANVLAYTEGYAVYAQFESFKYLDTIDQALLEAYKENMIASYDVIIVADIGIHYEGWSLDDFKSYLRGKGFSLNDDDMKEQYLQLQANPAAFEAYYVGYHEFASIKQDAKNQLGNQFNEKEFNKALLESGTATFEVVQRHEDQYISQVK